MTTAQLMNAAQVASLIGAGTSATSQYQAGKYQKKVQKGNAKTQGVMAQDAHERGERAQHNHRLKVAAIKGDQRASMGAAGTRLDTGDGLGLLEDTAEFGELDALTIRNNSQREEYGIRVGQANSEAQGSLAGTAGIYGAGATLLGGVGKVSNDWMMFRRGMTNPAFAG